MSDFSNAIQNLYERFLLRDVLSFIAPGAIVIVTTVYLFLPDILERHIPWPLYFPIFGLFFIVGFALQCFGEWIGIVHFWPKYRSNCRQRWSMWGCDWHKCDHLWWEEAQKEMAKFYKITECKESGWARQNYERWVVLKQMCINGFLAVCVAGALLLIHFSKIQWLILIVIILLTISLFWGSRTQLLRQDTWRKVVVDKLSENK